MSGAYDPSDGEVVDELANLRRTADGMSRVYLHFGGMAWPNPADPNDIEWTLRYGEPTREQLMVAASMVAAYKQLVADPQRTRNDKVGGIRAAQATSSQPTG